MRLLADENIPRPSIDALRNAGHDVASVLEDAPRSSDRSVLDRARSENRLLLTFDRDFGELVFHRGYPAQPGVIYLRFMHTNPAEAAELLADLAHSADIAFDGFFTVITRDSVRQRRLPPTSPWKVREPTPVYAVAAK